RDWQLDAGRASISQAGDFFTHRVRASLARCGMARADNFGAHLQSPGLAWPYPVVRTSTITDVRSVISAPGSQLTSDGRAGSGHRIIYFCIESLSGTAPSFDLPDHRRLDGRSGPCIRGKAQAEPVAVAVDDVVGQPSWRVHDRPHSRRRIWTRVGGRRSSDQTPTRRSRMAGLFIRRAARLRDHPLRLSIAPANISRVRLGR